MTVEIKPDYAKGYFNIGNVYLKEGKTEDAIVSFQRALELNPRYAGAHYYLSWIYFQREDYKSAIEHSDQAGKLESLSILNSWRR